MCQPLVFVTRRGAVLPCGGPTHRLSKEKHGYGILARPVGVRATSIEQKKKLWTVSNFAGQVCHVCS